MNLNPKQRVMLANAKSYIATVSRQAELAKDLPMAHALADVVAELHRVMTIDERLGRPAKVLKLKRPS